MTLGRPRIRCRGGLHHTGSKIGTEEGTMLFVKPKATRVAAVLMLLVGGTAYWSTSLAQPMPPPRHMATIDGHSTVEITYEGDIFIDGKIDGGSNVRLTSTRGSITIKEKIDGGSNVALRAAGAVSIGDKIDNPDTRVWLYAGSTARVGGKIDGGCQVWLRGPGGISVGDKVDNGRTVVRYCGKWSGPPNGVNGGAQVVEDCGW